MAQTYFAKPGRLRKVVATMPATITPETIDGRTQYVLRDDTGVVQTFDWLSAASLFAAMEGYDVREGKWCS